MTTQFRCLVPASDIGHVIGRKGETVQSLRDRSGATIKVHEGNSGDGLPIYRATMTCLHEAITLNASGTCFESKALQEHRAPPLQHVPILSQWHQLCSRHALLQDPNSHTALRSAPT